MNELRARLRNAVLLIAALAAAMAWARGGWALAVILLVTARAQWEFYALLDAARLPSFRWFGVAGGIAVVSATWWGFRHPGPDGPESLFAHAWFAAFFVIFARQFHQRFNPRPIETMSGTLMGLLYIALPMSFFVRLLMAWGDSPDGRWLLLYMIAVVKAGDAGAYFIGCAIGRHKMIPRISPAKSWEGFFGGVATSVAVSLAAAAGWPASVSPVTIPLAHAGVLGVALSVAGVLGDLAESLLKRAAGVKDAGALLPGLGGLLDVVDSLLPAAPILYLYLRHVVI
ncbi:MAG: phosphatidate cytidylyltransferase [Kiritimatiellae bacterium]|nr:phosphatidate cytidylyltransferase [Kiritimatiellia bacterium]